MKVYLSSTFLDLKSHRSKLTQALKKSGYEVVRMEDYVARDELVELACQGDVGNCDVYIGIIAWRYGHIPDGDSKRNLSVTELEYEAAKKKGIPTFTFLLDEQAKWPDSKKDGDAENILRFRNHLKKFCSGYFTNASDLCIEVQAALRIFESTKRSEQFDSVNTIVEAQDFGPSYMMNLQENFGFIREVPFIEIQLGPVEWWNTRLFLVASLAEEIGIIKGIVFVRKNKEFLVLVTPQELSKRIGKEWPFIKEVYYRFRKNKSLKEIEEKIWEYPSFFDSLGKSEEELKESIQENDLLSELGLKSGAELVFLENKNRRDIQKEILGRTTPFVALVRNDFLEGIVDRSELAIKLAKVALE